MSYETYTVCINNETVLLKDLIKDHEEWLHSRGTKGKRLNLSNQVIKFITFPQSINLSQAILTGTLFHSVCGNNVSFDTADCEGAVFKYCNFTDSLFSYTRLWGTYFVNTIINSTRFYHTQISRANFQHCTLTDIIFSNLSLKDSYFSNCQIYDLKFYGVSDIPDLPMACPREGSFIGWKKIECDIGTALIKLKITDSAKRSSATTKKCRCSKARVLGIYDREGNKLPIQKLLNTNYKPTLYEVGKMVYPDFFDPNRWNECSKGIHFFMEFNDAKNYDYY